MKIRQATAGDQTQLLALMREAHGHNENDLDEVAAAEEWAKTETATKTLLRDPLAGEAQLILDDDDNPVGYMVMCRGFSLDYGGYFTWVEETYLQDADQIRFRDKRYSP